MSVQPRKSYQFFFSHIQQSQRIYYYFLFVLTIILLILYRGQTCPPPLILLGLVAFTSLGVFMLIFHHIDHSGAAFEVRLRQLQRVAFWQSTLNLAFITFGAHLTGGVLSPLPFLYIIYLGVIAIYYPTRMTGFLTVTAIIFFGILILGYIQRFYEPLLLPLPVVQKAGMQVTGIIYAYYSLAIIFSGLVISIHARKTQAVLEEADRQNLYLDRLHALSHLGLGHDDVSGLYQTLVDQVRQALGADAIYITRWDSENGMVYPGAASGQGTASFTNMPPAMPRDITMTQSVWKAGKPLVAEDVFCTPYISPKIAQNFPAKSLLGLPLYGMPDKSFLGAMMVEYTTIHRFTPEEIEQAQQTADVAALLISRTRLYEETQRRAGLLEQMANQITQLTSDLRRTTLLPAIVESARNLLGAERAALHLYNRSTGKMHCEFSVGLSQAYLKQMTEHFNLTPEGQLLRSQNFVLVPDVHRDSRTSPIQGLIARERFRAYAVFALESATGNLGTLALYWDQPRAISSEEVDVGRLFAQRAGALLYSAGLYEQASEDSLTDVLTGLPNRRYLDQRLTEESERSNRCGRPYALLMLDLDGFKAVNDSFGHLIGDSVLQQISIALQRSLRSTDVIARYGGDEFAVILPEMEGGDAIRVAEKIKNVLASTRLHLPNETQRYISASIGVAVYPTDCPEDDDLFDLADQRLYQAKRQGSGNIVAGA